MIRHALTAFMLLATAACDPSTPSAPPPEQAPPPAARSENGCVPLPDWLASGKNSFKFSDKVENEVWTVSLALTREGKPYQGRLDLRGRDPGAVSVDEDDLMHTTKVCAGHVFVVNLAEERGGVLLIANQYQEGLALASLPYQSGDEDSAEVDMRAGVLAVNTRIEGRRNLIEDLDPEAAVPHGFVPEAIACTLEDKQGLTDIKLSIDAAGEVYAVNYLSVMPGGLSCSLDTTKGQDETTWRKAKTGIQIAWGKEEDASRVFIQRKGDTYLVDARQTRPPDFCGQSAQLADVITLQRANKTCVSVKWPQ